jgi:cysteine synthase A
MVYTSIKEIIGNTPLLRLDYISRMSGAEIVAKCEFMNPNGSVKDRIALAMIESGLKSNKINRDTIVIEPTSGNTGIALASICANMGIKLILTMPSSMSIERQKLLKAFGAKIELTDPAKGMKGAVDRAIELSRSMPNSFIPQQFENPANPITHSKTTAIEILKGCEGDIDIFVAAVGTGGTLTGVGEVLKEKNPNIKIIAVEPKDSPILSGGTPAPHKIQGIGAGFIPKVLNRDIYDEVITVSNEDAFATSKTVARKEGLLVGISAGANVWASMQMAKQYKNSRIVTILCDTGERYLSTTLFDD